MASVVPIKGTSGQFAVLRVLDFLKQCGAEESAVILKTDQEPAIEALIKDVVAARGQAATLVENSPVGSSGSNGVVERAVQGVEGQIRTLKLACEERLRIRLRPDDRLVLFLAEYSAHLLNRLEVGKDGKTAYERSRGKRATVLAVEFGEKLLWKVRRAGKQEKMNARWEYGVFVGIKPNTGEILVAVKGGFKQSVPSGGFHWRTGGAQITESLFGMCHGTGQAVIPSQTGKSRKRSRRVRGIRMEQEEETGEKREAHGWW